jgi:PIN domain nuclease of toxin-antitoxin system
MRILLDTCTFLWLNAEPQRLSTKALSACESPDNELFLSAVSVWEIAVKWGLGRLELPVNPDEYVTSRREQNGIGTLPLKEDAAVQLVKLPSLHRDPFDRMLICQAVAEGMAVMTPDPLITQYPVRVFW